MALVLPLLVMLLLGIVSSGIAYNHQVSLTHAAREAGRYGATLPVSTMGAWLSAVHDRAVEAATGSLDAGTAGLYICVAYVHPNGNSSTNSTARSLNGGATESGSTCFNDGRPNDEHRVQVRVAREVDFNALVFQTTLTLDSEAVNRFEAGLGL